MNKYKYILLGLFCIFLACLATNYDYDLFARLIVGERFIEEGILPYQDFLSYTPVHPWYDHEWGSGVIFYLTLKYFGAAGILGLHAILMFLTAVFVIKTQMLQKHAYPLSLTFAVVFLMLFSHLNPSLIRCHLFSFLFFAMFLYFLEKHKKQGSNLIWLIPPITAVWNNLHGGVVSGLGLVFMYLAGAVLERKPWKKYLYVLLVSTPLLIINPYGIKYLGFLFSATTMQRKYITEWWNFLVVRHFMYYIIPSLFLMFTFVLNFFSKRINITRTIVLGVTLYLGLMHVKLLSIALVAACALCGNDIIKITSKKLLRVLDKSLFPVILTLSLLIPLFSPEIPRATYGVFPLRETEFLKINNIKGNIVVPYAFGSYVSYKLYPDNLIYMDGRYEEVYDDKEFLMLMDYELAKPNWEDIVNNYPTDILMPQKEAFIYPVLKNHSDWTEIFEGVHCGIFVKKDKAAKHYEFVPESDINYYRGNIFKRGK